MLQSLAVFTNKQFQNISVAHFGMILGTTLPMPVLSVFLQIKGFSESQIGLAMGVTALSALLVRPWVGFRVDTQGSRAAILLGQILLFASTFGYMAANCFLHFFIVRILFGIGTAFYSTGSVTFASCIGTGDSNANAIAMYTLITMIALGISMSLAQAIFDHLGFYILVIASLSLIILAFSCMKFRAENIQPCSSKTRVPFAEVLKSPAVIATTFSQFAASFSFSALFAFVPLASLASNIQLYSLFFIGFSFSVIISRFYVQKINTLLGLEKTVVLSSITMLISIGLFLTGLSPVVLTVAGGLFGTGFGVIFPTLVLLLIRRIQENNRGTALSILSASSDIGNALSVAVLGIVAEHLGYPFLFLSLGVVLLGCTFGFHYFLTKNPNKL